MSSVEIHRRLRQCVRVKLIKFLLPVLVAFVLVGCKKSAPPTPPPATTPSKPWEPTQAQPKLPTIKLYIGPDILDAEMALTPKQIQTGMMFRTNIQETDSMIFVLPYDMRADFWMKNCPESISVAYITSDGVISEIHHLEHDDTNTVSSATDNIRFALETKDGWFKRHNIGTGTVIRTERGTLAETFLRQR